MHTMCDVRYRHKPPPTNLLLRQPFRFQIKRKKLVAVHVASQTGHHVTTITVRPPLLQPEINDKQPHSWYKLY
eukprot:3112553-Rhodomonas_salina.5